MSTLAVGALALDVRCLIGLTYLHGPWQFRVLGSCRDVPHDLVLAVLDLPYEEVLTDYTTFPVTDEVPDGVLDVADVVMGLEVLPASAHVAQIGRNLGRRWRGR